MACPGTGSDSPVSEKYNDYAKVAELLNNDDIRALIDDRSETIGKKIRENELKRIPFIIVVGEKEADSGKISVRRQGEGDKGQMPVESFVELIKEEIKKQIE